MLSGLKKIPLILDIQAVHPEPKVIASWDPQKRKEARADDKKVFAYRIVYRSQGHRVVGYLVEPKRGGKLPCIIWNRGGNGEFGSITRSAIFGGSMAAFAQAGYIVIASQYSGNDGGEGKEHHGGSEIEDVFALYEILKKYPRADTGRIGMFGSSRGGMMTYLALARVKWIRAAVVKAGLVNLFHQVKYRPKLQLLYKEAFGGSKLEYKRRSVVFWTNKLSKKAPILLMHGTADWRVNVQDTLDMGQRLYNAKIPYRMIIYEGDDHGLNANKKAWIAESTEWFDRFVKNKEALPDLKPHGK
jgi:dipeptidyl aminopeptidase/acylaminoacyl peptidase